MTINDTTYTYRGCIAYRRPQGRGWTMYLPAGVRPSGAGHYVIRSRAEVRRLVDVDLARPAGNHDYPPVPEEYRSIYAHSRAAALAHQRGETAARRPSRTNQHQRTP